MTSLVVAGSHPLMQKIRALASRLATCDTAALILGEEGTCKTDLARHIHQQSKRCAGPFVSADCKSTSTKEFADIVQEADGGTLFLANVDALDCVLQRSLLEILDRRDSQTASANFRLIASTESDLAPARSDLFARLSRVSLFLPPLRERRSDIPLLIRHLLDKHASELDGPVRHVPDDTLVLFWQYDWPGNLRELAEVVRQCASATTDGVIRRSLLPAPIRWSMKHGMAADRPGEGFEDSRSLGTMRHHPSILR